MQPVTTDDRRKELAVLLQQMQAQPSRDWSAEKNRAAVLMEMITASERAEMQGQQQG